jgi:uncharacterized membrane protein (UPF0182 family)
LGFCGIVYQCMVIRRMLKQRAYRPVFEDWAFHALLPAIAHIVFVGAAFAVSSHTREAFFAIGAAALVLLFVGIHNAWDAVVYQVLVKANNAGAEQKRAG